MFQLSVSSCTLVRNSERIYKQVQLNILNLNCARYMLTTELKGLNLAESRFEFPTRYPRNESPSQLNVQQPLCTPRWPLRVAPYSLKLDGKVKRYGMNLRDTDYLQSNMYVAYLVANTQFLTELM